MLCRSCRCPGRDGARGLLCAWLLRSWQTFEAWQVRGHRRLRLCRGDPLRPASHGNKAPAGEQALWAGGGGGVLLLPFPGLWRCPLTLEGLWRERGPCWGQGRVAKETRAFHASTALTSCLFKDGTKRRSFVSLVTLPKDDTRLSTPLLWCFSSVLPLLARLSQGTCAHLVLFWLEDPTSNIPW